MLKASALFYAIVISLLGGLLTSSLILSAYFKRLEIDTYIMQEQLQRNASSGITYLLSGQENVLPGNTLVTDLYNEGTDSVLLGLKAWGAYEVALSQAMWHGREVKLAALTGSLPDEKNRFALWLADQDRPLALAGNTIIKGDAFLPKAGVNRAYIEGQNYAGEKLIYGNVYNSGRIMPSFSTGLAKRLEELISGRLDRDSAQSITDSDSVHRSFFHEPLIVYEPGRIVLGENHCSGQVIIVSGREIIVKKSASLQNVLLAAPVIRIEDEFKGTLQAFAGDTLMIGKKCELDYPSALGIIRSSSSADHMLLYIGEDAKVKGAVVSWQEQYDVHKSMLISIDKKAQVTGQVHSAGLLDLKGEVKGNVIAARFLLKTPSSVYENHLLNAVIDITKLPRQFGGPVTGKGNKTVLKWLE
jgi:hypothetical protein